MVQAAPLARPSRAAGGESLNPKIYNMPCASCTVQHNSEEFKQVVSLLSLTCQKSIKEDGEYITFNVFLHSRENDHLVQNADLNSEQHCFKRPPSVIRKS